MAELSYPFDGGTGAILTEDDWSDMAKNWQDDGVISTTYFGAPLQVNPTGDPNTLTVVAGTAMVQGFMYRNTADLTVTFATNSDVNPRIDRVVLRLDRNSNIIQAVVKAGTPSSSPVAPAVDTTYPIFEMSLATFQINAGQSLPAGAITQDRTFTSRYIKVSNVTTGHPTGSIVYNPTEDKFYTIPDSGGPKEIGAPAAGGGSSAAYVRKSADQLITGTTAQTDDTHLQYVLPDGEDGIYLVEVMVFYWSDTPSSSMTFNFSGGAVGSPPVPRSRWIYQTSASAAPQHFAAGNTYNQAVGANASNSFYTVDFQWTGSLFAFGDTIKVRYTPAVSTVQWTISSGSWLKITKLGS